jgi:hypothetical protein
VATGRGTRTKDAKCEYIRISKTAFMEPQTLKIISSPVFNNTDLWVEQIARVEERRLVYRILVGKHKGKRPLRGPRRRWKTILKFIFKNRMRRREMH